MKYRFQFVFDNCDQASNHCNGLKPYFIWFSYGPCWYLYFSRWFGIEETRFFRWWQSKGGSYFGSFGKGKGLQQEMDPSSKLLEPLDHEPRLCCRINFISLHSYHLVSQMADDVITDKKPVTWYDVTLSLCCSRRANLT